MDNLKELKPDSVALLVPCGGPVEPRVFQSALNMVTTAQANGITVRQVGVTDRTLIHTARNNLAGGFLQTDCEWSFWLDSDMILEARTIPVMLRWAKSLSAKMLTGIYYQRMGQHKPVLWRDSVSSVDGKYVHEKREDDCHYFVYPGGVGGRPFRVDVAGFGCSLIHRDVFDALKHPYFKFDWREGQDGKVREMSEDFYFYTKAKAAGFELWAVPELDCGHLGQAPIIRHADMKAKLDMSKMAQLNTEVVNK